MMSDFKEIIAKRAALELSDGDVVNLGIGIPTMVADFIGEDKDVIFQTENGCVGIGPAAEEGKEDFDLANAGSIYATIRPGASFCDSATAFALIRGGHIDAVILGAMEVDAKGNIANWKVPGKKVAGMGGAMDLVSGARRVIVTMQHTQNGVSKILKECTLPLTAKGKVDMIITEMAVLKVTDKGLVLMEIGPGVTVDDVIAATDANLIIPEKVGSFK